MKKGRGVPILGLKNLLKYGPQPRRAFNLGAGHEIKIIDPAHWINELTENPAGTTIKTRRDWDKKTRLLSSIDKARRVLSYEPRTNFKESLGHTLNWFTENWNHIKQSAEF